MAYVIDEDQLRLRNRSHPWIRQALKLPLKFLYCPYHLGCWMRNYGDQDDIGARQKVKRAAWLGLFPQGLGRGTPDSDPSQWDFHADWSGNKKGPSKRAGKPVVCRQRQSPFFEKLPIEIRMLIWKYVCGSMGVVRMQIKLQDDRLRLKANMCNDPADTYTGYRQTHSHDPATWKAPNVLPLLCSCRLMHSEILPMIYDDKFFVFQDPTAFVVFSKVISSANLARVKRVSIDHDTGPGYLSLLRLRGSNERTSSKPKHIASIVSAMPALQALTWGLFAHPPPPYEMDDWPFHGIYLTEPALSEGISHYIKPVRDAVPESCDIIVGLLPNWSCLYFKPEILRMLVGGGIERVEP